MEIGAIVSVLVLLLLAYAGARETSLTRGEAIFGSILAVILLFLAIMYLQFFGSDSNSL
jgi:membrane protein DedA with SNARE-associated domain